MSIADDLYDIFWNNTTAIDEPGDHAVLEHIIEHYPLIESPARPDFDIWYEFNTVPSHAITLAGVVEFTDLLDQLREYYPEEFI